MKHVAKSQRTPIPDCLFTPTTASHCRGVYPLHGGTQWEVKVKLWGKIERIGKENTASAAIGVLVEWYVERFGPSWEYVAACREANPWKIVREPSGRYALDVYLFGCKRRVGSWSTKEAARTGRKLATTTFITSELLRLGFSPSIARTYPVLWRITGPTPPPPPSGSVWWADAYRRLLPCHSR